jgi:FkbM family methyltransferase
VGSLGDLAQLARVLRSADGRHAARRWKPFTVPMFHLARALAAEGVRPRTIVDGGANVGQFARAAVETFADARVICFEPLPDVAATLRANLADCTRVTVHECALGDADGTVAFRRNVSSPSSSVLPLGEAAARSFPELSEAELLDVPVCRLDTVLRDERLDGPVLLKLDLQGYELRALDGAAETLPRMEHVLLETSFTGTYDGEPLFAEVYTYMEDHGFRLVRPLAALKDATDAIAEVDALFARHAPA